MPGNSNGPILGSRFVIDPFRSTDMAAVHPNGLPDLVQWVRPDSPGGADHAHEEQSGQRR